EDLKLSVTGLDFEAYKGQPDLLRSMDERVRFHGGPYFYKGDVIPTDVYEALVEALDKAADARATRWWRGVHHLLSGLAMVGLVMILVTLMAGGWHTIQGIGIGVAALGLLGSTLLT